MKRFSGYFFLFILFGIVSCKTNHALYFDGATDYIELGNIYDDAQLPITICAWVRVDTSKKSQTPIFVSQDNNPVYNGFWLVINPTHLFAGYGDGLGENHHLYRRDKSAPHAGVFGKWVHVAAVIRGATDMDIYLDGVNIGGEYTGSSNHPMASQFPDDVAKIGYWSSNNTVYRYKGEMDEVKIWNRALNDEELKAEMKKKLTSNLGLIGYWNFNEKGNIVFDKSRNKFNGKLKGKTKRVEATDIPGF